MTEKFIMAGTTALHIGDSEVGSSCVVLVHGYLESMYVWDDFVSLLTPSVRVITLDLPGHGISVVDGDIHTMEYLADAVAGMLGSLGIASCTIVGHSMGGYVALAFAARHATMTDGLVLLSSTPNADSPEKSASREREIALVAAGKKELLAKVAPAAGFAVENRHRMRDHIADLAEQVYLTEDDGVIAILRGMRARADQNDMLRTLSARKTFIFGLHDDYIPVAVAEKIASDHPDATVVWLEHSGHMGFFEEPERCAEAILQTAVPA